MARDGLELERETANGRAEIVHHRGRERSDVPDANWKRAHALITGVQIPIDSEVVAKLESCRVITRIGVGYDLIDIRAAGKAGIAVCNVPDYGTTEVADHAIALILNFARGLLAFNERFREDPDKGWSYLHAPTLTRVAGKTLGIIGLGRIGTASALRAKGFGLRVVAYDPYIPDGQEKALDVERFDDLHTMLAECDFVTVHCLANEETYGLIGDSEIEKMKPGAILANTSRGTVVVLDAVERGLRSGQLGAAGLDVFPEEPPSPDHSLLQAWRAREDWVRDRLVITPHAAFYSSVGMDFLRKKALRTCLDFLENGILNNCVNRKFLVTN